MIPVLMFLGLGAFSQVCGDEVVMTTGERFSSDKVWTEGDQIRFNMQGLVVSVNKSDVAQIIRNKTQGERPTTNEKSRPPMNGLSGHSKDRDFERPEQYPVRNPTPATGLSGKRSFSHPGQRPAPGGSSKDQGIGIRQIAWQLAPDQIPGLKKVATDPAFGGIEQYWQPEQALVFGNAPLDGLVYGFWKDKLYSIMMWADGRIGYNRLRKAVFSRFGLGSQVSPEVERYTWDEKVTQRMLEFDAKRNTGIFVMRCTALDEIIKQRYPPSP